MKQNLIFSIAFSLALARWRQTLVAAVGVMFSVTMFVTLLGFMNGLNKMLDGLILNRTPHIKLFNEIKPTAEQPITLAQSFSGYRHFIHSIKPAEGRQEIYNVEAIQNSLQQDKRVLGVAPSATTQVFFSVGAIDLTGMINGVDPEIESDLFFFRDYVIEGNYLDLKTVPNSIILGKTAADLMLANLGDVVQVTSVTGEKIQLKVVGYFQSGIADIDKVQSYTSLSTAQKLLGKPKSYITDLQVKLKDLDLAPEVAKEYAQIYQVDAEDIQTVNAQFETGTKIRTLISYAVGITLLIVAGFGIYNILNMLIYEKMDSIAILKATGFSGSDVRRIFLSISLSIGIAGALVGVLLGFTLSSLIDQIPFETTALPSIKTFPVDYNPKYYLIGAGFAVMTTYIAGWLPARKASKVDPVVIIRGK
jgi:lipoprotein-releasing system permease protein